MNFRVKQEQQPNNHHLLCKELPASRFYRNKDSSDTEWQKSESHAGAT
jgi:hypothetical protein